MDDIQVIRTYRFESGTSGRRFVCESRFLDVPFPEVKIPDVVIEVEQGDKYRNGGVLKPQIHVLAPVDTPKVLILQELDRFISTYKQMYDL